MLISILLEYKSIQFGLISKTVLSGFYVAGSHKCDHFWTYPCLRCFQSSAFVFSGVRGKTPKNWIHPKTITIIHRAVKALTNYSWVGTYWTICLCSRRPRDLAVASKFLELSRTRARNSGQHLILRVFLFFSFFVRRH